MTPIKEIPNLNWTDHAAAEICLAGQALLDMSASSWRIGDIAIVGLVYSSFTSPPYLWMALAQGIKFSDLLDFRRKTELIPPGAYTYVNQASETAYRFARLYGFRGTGELVVQNGHTYLVMRRG